MLEKIGLKIHFIVVEIWSHSVPELWQTRKREGNGICEDLGDEAIRRFFCSGLVEFFKEGELGAKIVEIILPSDLSIVQAFNEWNRSWSMMKVLAIR